MAEFTWEARGRTGEVRKGVMEAENEEAVNNRLRQQQLAPVKVKKKSRFSEIKFGSPKVNTKDLVTFTRLFATMIDAGLPLVQCLEILGSQQSNPAFGAILKDVRNAVEQGATFSEALKRHPKAFDDLFTNLVHAGEVGGILDGIMSRLSVYLEKRQKLIRQVRGALVYPSVVAVIAALVMTVLLTFVIPSFENMFKDFGGKAQLPWLTQVMVGISHNFVSYFPFIVVAVVLLIVGFGYMNRQPAGKAFTHRTILKLPIIGAVLRKIAVARFTRTLGTLLQSGVPILDALQICAVTSGNVVIEAAVMHVRQSISEGKNMAEPLTETKVFPDMVVQMIAVGEQTGALDQMLNKIADFYEEETDVAVGALTSALEPVMMVGVGGMVGVVLIAMYLPVFSLAGNIKAGLNRARQGSALRMQLKLGIPEMLASAPLARRLAGLTAARLVLLSLSLVLVGAFYLRGKFGLDSFTLRVALQTFGLSFALTGAYAALLRKGKHLERLAEAQLVLDQLTWTVVAYLTGGASSGATSFYGLSCLVGASLLGLRGAFLAALSGALSYGGLVFVLQRGLLSAPRDQPASIYHLSTDELVFYLLVNLLVLIVVAVLAGTLADRLRWTGGELALATARADQAERMAGLGRLAAGLAHEIRNPLGSIAGSIQLLRTATGLSDEDQRLCDIIQRETGRLNDLVTDMVDLSKPKKPIFASVDAARVAREVVALTARSGRAVSDVEVSYSGLEAAPIWADGAQLRQMIWNLVRNAVQASSPGDGVEVAVEIIGKDTWLRVSDRGVGIDEAARERLFDAFFTTRSQGTGMGLAVVKRIADEHSFSIAVDSSRGRGATFRVNLGAPRASQPPPAAY